MFARFADAEGRRIYDELLAERELIDAEFADTGLPAPSWTREDQTAQIAVSFAAPLPWDEAAQDEQLAQLHQLANQFVNSLRPRLERASAVS